ncbi:MAG TPA: mechanosensitive ion channel family protein [Candidatus Saccharimonadales bacterium]
MFEQDFFDKAGTEIQQFVSQPNAYRAFLILAISMILAYWVSRFIAKGVIRVAQVVASHSDNESDEERFIRLRQVETYLSVAVAAIRAFIVAIVGYIAWKLLIPEATSSIAAIGAGTFFVVFAGQTVGILLRDITAGATMIIEKWFNVGDFIKVEPFWDVAGVVERFTLRSTRIRTISGEAVWIHNQHMTAVHVTPKALRTLAVDIFVRDRVEGERAIESVLNTVPTGPTLLARPLRIKYAERWDDELWRVTVVGQVPPGREWLIEKFFVDALKDIDADKKRSERIIMHEPIARFADPNADRRFKRAVRADRER